MQNLPRKPPVPKQVDNFMSQTSPQQFSFLKGNSHEKRQSSMERKQAELPDHLKTMKNGVPKPPPRRN